MAKLLKDVPDELEVKKYNEAPKPLYICIEGNIGSGKTTLARALATHLNALFVPEKFEQNHLLPLFYQNPALYSFPLEYSFLISRFEQLKQTLELKNGVMVSDFSIYKCLWFAKLNLAGKEFKLFKKHVNAFINQLPAPQLIVHLDTSLSNLKQNIKKRGRSYEMEIKDTYLSEIGKHYAKGLKGLRNTQILEIKVPEYHMNLEKKSIKTIAQFLKENFGGQY